MQQTKFRMLRWCLSIRHYWGSVGFSKNMFLWSFICAVPKCPKHIQVLSTSCNMWLNGLILTCLDALKIWTNAILLFSWTEFWQLQRAARRMVDDIGSPADSGAPILKNLDEIQYASLAAAWHPMCLRYTLVYMSSTHQCLQIFKCEKNLGLSVWTTKCLAWSDPMPKAELLRHTQQRLTTEVERWLFSFWRIQTKCLGILLRPLWW